MVENRARVDRRSVCAGTGLNQAGFWEGGEEGQERKCENRLGKDK